MCLAGSLGTWSAFAILGNTSLYFELNDVVPVTDILENDGAPAAIVATVLGLPLGGLVLVVFLVLAMIFLATMLDSASFALASVASRELHPEEEPPRWHRLFWAAMLGAVAIVMMYGGGLEPLQTLTVISAFPLLFILIVMTLSFRRWLIEDRAELGGPPSLEDDNSDTPETVGAGEQEKEEVHLGEQQRR
jgi:BCCT family betaine/carnitine transporter